MTGQDGGPEQPRHRPEGERRLRSRVDDAHAAISEAVSAARLAGRFEAVLDEHPGPVAREQYDRADGMAVRAVELAHGALDLLVRRQV